ncbi:MAG: hypothetical protein KGI58_01085 [Patescibacteria group bacterium]|nr:hypothetical protein [Patescibacteria group bacterium]
MENQEKTQVESSEHKHSCCDNKNCHNMHHMGMCGCHGGKYYFMIKAILKIIIVILIFWCGFKLGEITGSIRGYEHTGGRYGFGMMNGYDNYNNGFDLNSITSTPTK